MYNAIFSFQWSADGEHLFCQKGGIVSVLSLRKGSVISSIGRVETDYEEDTINCFILSDDDTKIITHHKSGLFKLWDWTSNNLK